MLSFWCKEIQLLSVISMLIEAAGLSLHVKAGTVGLTGWQTALSECRRSYCFWSSTWRGRISMLPRSWARVPRGSDDRNVASLTFIRHTRLNIYRCVFVLWSHRTRFFKPRSQRPAAVLLYCSSETQSEVSSLRCFPGLEVHFKDSIMIDCWYDFMTHCWPAAHLLLLSIIWLCSPLAG